MDRGCPQPVRSRSGHSSSEPPSTGPPRTFALRQTLANLTGYSESAHHGYLRSDCRSGKYTAAVAPKTALGHESSGFEVRARNRSIARNVDLRCNLGCFRRKAIRFEAVFSRNQAVILGKAPAIFYFAEEKVQALALAERAPPPGRLSGVGKGWRQN